MRNYNFISIPSFQPFVETVIKNTFEKKNYFTLIEGLKFDLKPILYRFFYFQLLNDKFLYQAYSARKNLCAGNVLNKIFFKEIAFKKISFVYSSFYILRNLIKFFEVLIYLFFLYKQLLILRYKKKDQNCNLLVYVSRKKHVNYINSILSNLKINYKFLVLTEEHAKELSLKNSESVYCPNASFGKLNYFFQKNAYLIFFYKIFLKLCSQNKFKAVMTVEGDDFKSEILSQVANIKNIPTICLQWGCYPLKPKIAFHLMSSKYFFSWGKYFSKQLKIYNKNIKFIDTGNPLMINNKLKKKNQIMLLIQPCLNNAEKDCFKDIFFKILNIVNKNSDYIFIVRNHPDYNFDQLLGNNFDKMNFKIQDYSIPIAKSLSEAKVVIGMSSSALAESLFYDAIPVSYQTYKNKFLNPNLNKMKIGFSSTSPTDIENFIKLLINNSSYYKKYLNNIKKKKSLFFRISGISSKRLFSKNLKNIMKL